MNEEMKAEIKRAARHILDNYDTIIEPKIPNMVEDIREIIELYKSGNYTEEELLDIAKEKAERLSKTKIIGGKYEENL